MNTLLFISPWKIFSTEKPRGERIKGALQEAGPIYIKFGQLLSTRPDVVPTDIARALQSLQDDLPPFSSKIAIEIIEKELGAPIDNFFDNFDNNLNLFKILTIDNKYIMYCFLIFYEVY